MTNETKLQHKSAFSTKQIAQIGLLMAIEMLMWLAHLGQVPMGPLNMSFLTVPVAIGAIMLGPVAGAILGGTFGLTSLLDAISHTSVMTGWFFDTNPLMTVLLCVGTRILMGWCTGLISSALRRVDHKGWINAYGSALAAPVLNTIFFMSYICLVFYQTEFVQKLVADRGATNPFMFVVLLVGVQGVVEAVVCCLVGGTIAKTLPRFFRRTR